MEWLVAAIRLPVGLLVLAVAIPAILALFGFAVPFFDLFNHIQLLLFLGSIVAVVLALLFFGISGKMTWLAVLGLAASSWTFVPEWLSSLAPRQPSSDVTTVKLITHNVFGLNYDMERVAAVIAAEDPDIIALQEYFPEQVDGLDALLKPNYPYWIRCRGGKRANLGLYSRLPFDSETTVGECPQNARGDQRTAHILARFTLSTGDSFSVMTTHLDWPYPIERQQTELAEAVSEVGKVVGPLVLVGDFNSTPWSYALRGFAADTGLTRETRNLPTYPEVFMLRRLVPTASFLPLDQVFQRGVTVHELHRGAHTGSDHLPVVATFSVSASP